MIHYMQFRAALECYRASNDTSRKIAIYRNCHSDDPQHGTHSAVSAEVHYNNSLVVAAAVHCIDLELLEVHHSTHFEEVEAVR